MATSTMASTLGSAAPYMPMGPEQAHDIWLALASVSHLVWGGELTSTKK